VPLGECTGGLGCPAHTVIDRVIKQEAYQLDHFGKYPLFRSVSRYSVCGLAEWAVGESTHVLAECNERKRNSKSQIPNIKQITMTKVSVSGDQVSALVFFFPDT
jgi:hypothetical protein